MVVKLGYMPMITRFTPTEALEHAIEAERMGFDSIWVDDHFLPVPPMAQSGFAWTWMSSALQATKRVFFSTAVTAPIMRYNPAIVAQAFATMGAMYPGRVGIGAHAPGIHGPHSGKGLCDNSRVISHDRGGNGSRKEYAFCCLECRTHPCPSETGLCHRRDG